MAAGTQESPSDLEHDGVQLTWPLPAEVLAQMDPETRNMLLQAMQHPGRLLHVPCPLNSP